MPDFGPLTEDMYKYQLQERLDTGEMVEEEIDEKMEDVSFDE